MVELGRGGWGNAELSMSTEEALLGRLSTLTKADLHTEKGRLVKDVGSLPWESGLVLVQSLLSEYFSW